MSDFTEFAPNNPIDVNSFQGGVGMVSYGPGDERLIVGFYPRDVLNPARSQAEGRPVHENRDYIKIQQPGEKLNVVDRPITEFDKARFPRQWAAYQQKRQQVPEGIPLSLLFPHLPAIVGTLREYNVHTVEQLAHLSAHGITTVGMGAQDWVNKAQAYMKQAEKGVDFHRFNKEMETKDAKIASLERQIADLTARFAQITSAQVGKPVPVMPNLPNFDPQTSLINNTMQPQVPMPPVEFSNSMTRRGRPKGSKNKSKEI